MADFETTIAEIAELNDNLSMLNSTVGKTIEAFGGEAKRATKTLEKLNAAQAAAAKELEAHTKAQKDSRNYIKELAESQYEASKQSRSFGRKLDDLAGESVAFHKGLLRAKDTLASLAPLGKGIADTARAMYDGQKGASAYNKGLEGLGDTIEKVGSQFGILGTIIGKVLNFFIGYAIEVNKLSDRLYKSYGDLAKSGLSAADGMIGLADAARRLGYGLDEAGLQAFAHQLKESSSDLALLAGSAVDGRKRFTEIGAALADRGPVQRAFGNLGYNVEDLAKMSAKYIQQEVTMGRTKGRTDRDLVEGTKEYIRLLDLQAKLTGQSVDSLQDQMDANLRNERFQARLLELEAQGPEGIKAAQNLRLNMAALSKVAPQVAEGLMDLASGYPQTKKAQQAMLSGMADVPRAMERQLGGGFRELGQAAKNTTDIYGVQLGKFGLFGEVLGSLYEQVKLGTLSQQDFDKQIQKLIKEQKLQEAGADGVVDAQTGMRIEQMKTRDALQNLVLSGIVPVTSAMEGLASVVNNLTSMLPGGASRSLTAQQKAADAANYAQMGTGQRIMSGAARAVETVADYIPGMGGLAKQAMSERIKTETAGRYYTEADKFKVEDLFDFQGGVTGDLAHFRQLDPEVQNRAMVMAAEYLNLTGKKLKLTSAFRSAEEQARVDSGSNPKAAPGRSLHNVGRAIDFDRADVSALQQSGLLAKHGFTGLANDPVHIQALQLGGPALRSRSYLVGERGPELFTPGVSGAVTSNDQLQRAMGAGLDQQISLTRNQISQMEELISLMRNQNNISSKILQYSTS